VCDIIWLQIAAGWVIVFVIRSVAAIKMCTDKGLTMHASIGYCYFSVLSKGKNEQLLTPHPRFFIYTLLI